MATKKVKWIQKTGSSTSDLLHPETEVSQIVDFPDVSKYLTTDTVQTVTGKKAFTGYAYMNGTANSTDTAPQFYGLRVKGSTGYGAQLNFGDGNYVYFYEYEDDRLRLHTKKFDLDSLSEGLSINKNVGTEGQVLTSHGAKAPTWETPKSGSSYTAGTGISISGTTISTTAASSSASGHVSTGSQSFAGRKSFEGGINITSGSTIQLNGSSGKAGYVLTSNGTSAAPSWNAIPSGGGSALDSYPVGSIYICWYYASSTTDAYHPAHLFGGSWTAIPSGYALWTWRSSLTATDTAHEQSAGLPNITGTLGKLVTRNSESNYSGFSTYSGAFTKNTSTSNYGYFTTTSTTSTGASIVNFNASSSNSIYGSSTTVQPPAYKIFAWRRTG